MIVRETLVGLSVGVAIFAAVAAGPWTPFALDRAATLAVDGDIVGALDAYAAIASSVAPPKLRAEALWRAALLAGVESKRVGDAKLFLTQLAQWFPASERAPDALEQLAALDERGGAYDHAAEEWEQAAQLALASPEAGRRWIRAGLAYARDGSDREALRALDKAASYPLVAAEADVEWARLALLGDDPEDAVGRYDAVLAMDPRPAMERLATRGKAIAESRLGGSATGAVASR